ncbi:MAG: DUF229 domain-containing protein [Chlamydiae bacterium]|nr:DUF229 domain-containing protein [Chlamydiota bacterium]
MFSAFFFLSLVLTRLLGQGAFWKTILGALQDFFFIQFFLSAFYIFSHPYAEIFFSTISFFYFVLIFLDLQIERIYKRGLIWSDFQWFEKSLWSLKKSVFYELGFLGFSQLIFILLVWCTCAFNLNKTLLNPYLGGISFFSLFFEKHLFLRYYPFNRANKPESLLSFLPSFFHFDHEQFDPIDPENPFLRKTLCYQSPSLFSLKKEKPNVVVLHLESLSMRDLDFTPFFKKLTHEGIFFDQFYSNFPVSSPAAVSTLFGIPPFQEYFRFHSLNQVPIIGMPQMFKQLGYFNAHITSTYTEAKKEYIEDTEGFDYYAYRDDYIEKAKGEFISSFMVDDRLAYQDLMDQLDQKTSEKKPFFCFFSNGFGHHPWEVPKEDDRKEKENLKKLRQSLKVADNRLEEFFLKAEQRPWFKDTLFILLGDHGQPMGEHDTFQIRTRVYQENVHVPCVFLKKGELEAQKFSFVASQIDIFPTLIDLFREPVVHHSIGYPLSRKKDHRFQLLGNLGYSKDIALREGPYKITPNEIFNIDEDPKEKRPLSLEMQKHLEPLQEKLAQGFAIIDMMNTFKLWVPNKGEKLSFFAMKDEAKYIETLKKYPQPKELNWIGNLASFFPSAPLLKKISSLKSLKIKDALLDSDILLAFIHNNRLKDLVLDNVYGIDSCLDQLSSLETLETLHLEGVDIDENSLLALIQKNPIEELTVYGVAVDPDRLFGILQTKQLKKLSLDLRIENSHLSLLDNSKFLRSLVLKDAQNIDLYGLNFLQNKPISYLNLFQLKSWGISYFNFLKKLPLVFFGLESESFSDQDLMSFLDLSLVELEIYHCPKISNQGIIEFTKKANKRLRIIYGHRIFFDTRYYKLKYYNKEGDYEFAKKEFTPS